MRHASRACVLAEDIKVKIRNQKPSTSGVSSKTWLFDKKNAYCYNDVVKVTRLLSHIQAR